MLDFTTEVDFYWNLLKQMIYFFHWMIAIKLTLKHLPRLHLFLC